MPSFGPVKRLDISANRDCSTLFRKRLDYRFLTIIPPSVHYFIEEKNDHGMVDCMDLQTTRNTEYMCHKPPGDRNGYASGEFLNDNTARSFAIFPVGMAFQLRCAFFDVNVHLCALASTTVNIRQSWKPRSERVERVIAVCSLGSKSK